MIPVIRSFRTEIWAVLLTSGLFTLGVAAYVYGW